MLGFKIERFTLSKEAIELEIRAQAQIDTLLKELYGSYGTKLGMTLETADHFYIDEENRFDRWKNQGEKQAIKGMESKPPESIQDTRPEFLKECETIFEEIKLCAPKNPSHLYELWTELGYVVLLLNVQQAVDDKNFTANQETLKKLAHQLQNVINKLAFKRSKQHAHHKNKQINTQLWHMALCEWQKKFLAKYKDTLQNIPEPEEATIAPETPLPETAQKNAKTERSKSITSWSKRIGIVAGSLTVLDGVALIWRRHGHDAVADTLQQAPTAALDIVMIFTIFATFCALLLYFINQDTRETEVTESNSQGTPSKRRK